MADVSVTAANVAPDSGTILEQGIAGAAITAGQTVYLDNTTSTYKLADANLSAAAAVTRGIALCNAASGQPIVVARSPGTLNPGFTVGVGTPYFQSATAGGICPAADLTTGHRTTFLGIGITASQLSMNVVSGGVAIP